MRSFYVLLANVVVSCIVVHPEQRESGKRGRKAIEAVNRMARNRSGIAICVQSRRHTASIRLLSSDGVGAS